MEEEIKESVSDSSKNKKVFIIGGVVVVALGLVGFLMSGFASRKAGEKMAENILENELGGKVDIGSNGTDVSIETDRGNVQMGGSAVWPTNMPEDVPRLTAGKLLMAASVSTGWQVVAEDVSQEDYTAYYTALKGKNWVESGMMFDPNIGMVQMTKGQYTLVLAFDSEEKSLSLFISTQEE